MQVTKVSWLQPVLDRGLGVTRTGSVSRSVCLCLGASVCWYLSAFLVYLACSFSPFKAFFYWNIVALQCCILLCRKVNQPHLHMQPLFLGFPSHLGHHRALSRVPCALQYVLISYLFYTQYQQCTVSVPVSQLIHSPPFPLVSIPSFSASLSLFLSLARVGSVIRPIGLPT